MTATLHSLAEARKRKISRDAKAALRNGVVYLDPMAAWYSAGFPLTTIDPNATFKIGIVSNYSIPADLIELPSDTEPA